MPKFMKFICNNTSSDNNDVFSIFDFIYTSSIVMCIRRHCVCGVLMNNKLPCGIHELLPLHRKGQLLALLI